MVNVDSCLTGLAIATVKNGYMCKPTENFHEFHFQLVIFLPLIIATDHLVRLSNIHGSKSA